MPALMQWLHLAGVIVAVGGTIFVRLVLLRSFVAIDAQARQRIMAGVTRWFFPLLWVAIAAIALSGVYNVILALHIPSQVYRAVLSLKILLALVLFGIAFAISLPWPAFAGMQKKRPFWLTANIVLAAIIVFLSAFLRRL